MCVAAHVVPAYQARADACVLSADMLYMHVVSKGLSGVFAGWTSCLYSCRLSAFTKGKMAPEAQLWQGAQAQD